jgi:ATP-binding cassette, subfamily B, bacterial
MRLVRTLEVIGPFSQSRMHPGPFNDLTIVVVEDHDDARRYLGLFLSRLGAKVILASDGFEGLDAIKVNRPNLILSDIKMPGRDGYELLREIRALGSNDGGGTPIIAMSGLQAPAERMRIVGAGFQAFLPKPFGPERLVETMQKVLAD